MDYIFNDWEKILSNFADSVEKDLEEIRQCKSDVQKMKLEVVAEMQKGRYVRDDNRLVLSAPEIVIGNVDRDGTLFAGGSTIIIRGTDVGLQAAGEGGTVETRAAGIRQIAEDPGVDGNEHVVYNRSEVVSQARNIIIQSDDVLEAFSPTAVPAGNSGVHIHADQTLEIEAAMTAESREALLEETVKDAEERQKALKELANEQKKGLKESFKDIEKLIEEKEKLSEDYTDVRTNAPDIMELDRQIREMSSCISTNLYGYCEVLSQLAEANRLVKSYKAQKDAVIKGDDFKQKSTGASVTVTGENISLVSADGEGNLRDNEGSGISVMANNVSIAAIEKEGKLKEKGKVDIKAMNIEVATGGETDQKYEEGELTTATYTADGDFTLRSKNIAIEGVDYEVAEKKRKEKALTADSRIKLRAKTVEVSTEASANIEVDDTGALTKANYTAEGDFILRSKTVTVESVDYDLENGEKKEKALTAEGKVSVRAEKMDLAATDTEGKATGSINVNAKAIAVKTMDVDKDSKADSALAAGSTMVLVSEKMFVGAKTKDVKSKKVQVVSEEVGAFADKTLEIQQGDGKALVQLEGGNFSASGSKTQLYGETTVNAKTEIKGEFKAPKITGDDIQAKSHFKSTNIEDGMAAGGGGGGGSLSAKLQTEDAPEEK